MSNFYTVGEIQCLRNFPWKLTSEELEGIQQYCILECYYALCILCFPLTPESKVWEDLIHLMKKKNKRCLYRWRRIKKKKNVLIKISKSRKREHISTCIWLNNYFAQLKTNLFYNLISKCSSDLLYIEFAELVTYNWKKAKISYSWSLFQF